VSGVIQAIVTSNLWHERYLSQVSCWCSSSGSSVVVGVCYTVFLFSQPLGPMKCAWFKSYSIWVTGIVIRGERMNMSWLSYVELETLWLGMKSIINKLLHTNERYVKILLPHKVQSLWVATVKYLSGCVIQKMAVPDSLKDLLYLVMALTESWCSIELWGPLHYYIMQHPLSVDLPGWSTASDSEFMRVVALAQ